MQLLLLLLLLQTFLLSAATAGCPDHQTTTLELSASPNDRTHTVGREENFTLELTCTLYNCIGNISWSIPPELQNKTEITNPSLWKSILTVSSLSAAESGEMPHKITCRYMNLEKTYLLNITAKPYVRDHQGIQYAKAGDRILCPVFRGNPPVPIFWEINRKDISVFGDDFDVTDNGMKLVIRRTSHTHSDLQFACILNGDFESSNLRVTINVTFQDPLSNQTHTQIVRLGESVEVMCPNWTHNVTWTCDVDIEERCIVSYDKMTLEISTITESDIGCQLVCLLENGVSTARDTTTLLGREYLSVCTEREESADRVEHVVKETLRTACGEDKDCVYNTNISSKRIAPGVFEVWGDVDSTQQPVKLLNDTLLNRSDAGYDTHGLTLKRNNCKEKMIPPDHDAPPSSPPPPQVGPSPHSQEHNDHRAVIVGIAAVVLIAVFAMLVITALLILCRCRKDPRVNAASEAPSDPQQLLQQSAGTGQQCFIRHCSPSANIITVQQARQPTSSAIQQQQLPHPPSQPQQHHHPQHAGTGQPQQGATEVRVARQSSPPVGHTVAPQPQPPLSQPRHPVVTSQPAGITTLTLLSHSHSPLTSPAHVSPSLHTPPYPPLPTSPSSHPHSPTTSPAHISPSLHTPPYPPLPTSHPHTAHSPTSHISPVHPPYHSYPPYSGRTHCTTLTGDTRL